MKESILPAQTGMAYPWSGRTCTNAVYINKHEK